MTESKIQHLISGIIRIKMRKSVWKFLFVFLPVCIFLAVPEAFAQCQSFSDTLIFEDFDQALSEAWVKNQPSDGGAWYRNTGKIGYFGNPGTGKWLYVNDEKDNNVGTASIVSPLIDISHLDGNLTLSFDVNFQEYSGKGMMKVEAGSDGNWEEIYTEREDFSGNISLEIRDILTSSIRFRITYDDEGSWGWGMGIDNFLVKGNQDICGDGICSGAENPLDCPGDCPALNNPNPKWVPFGEDINGNAVNYSRFNHSAACDDCSEKINLGFEFDFFGRNYSSVWINVNGNLTFSEGYLKFTPESFCLNGPVMIAPFFSDVDLTPGGKITYFIDPNHQYAVITWEDVRFFGCEGQDCDLRNNFQVILTDGTISSVRGQMIPSQTNIIFNYGDMNWTTGKSSGGERGFWGSPATVGSNSGDGQQCFDYGVFGAPSYEYYGNSQDQSCPANGIHHLDFTTLFLNGGSGEFLEGSGSIGLTGSAAQNGNYLYWTTDLPEGIDYFVLEKSFDNRNFEELDIIFNGDVQRKTQSGYEYLDGNPNSDIAYYRLIEIQSTGSIVYSDTIAVTRKREGVQPGSQPFSFLTAGPNPFDRELMISYDASEEVQILYLLTDMAGRQHLTGSFQALPGMNSLELRIPDLPRGMYVLTFYSPSGKSYINLVKD